MDADNAIEIIRVGKAPKTPQWKRVRQMIRGLVSRRSLVSHQYALLEGVDLAVNYINGYVAAGKGQSQNDYSGAELQSASIQCVWWRAGWADYKAGKPMNPKAFSDERHAEIVARLAAA